MVRKRNVKSVRQTIDGRIWNHPIVNLDRVGEVAIFFEGREIKAYENETVAAALYANGLRIFSRSFKYHRPRGFFCAIGKCSSCMMTIDGVPNIRTCVTQVRDGMRIKRQSSFPNVDHDILNVIDKLDYFSISSGFYHKKLIKPSLLRNFYLNTMARSIGLGRLPEDSHRDDPLRLGTVTMNVEIAVSGGGPAGLMAALEAGRLSRNVVIIDDKSRLGGQLVKQTHRFFGASKHYAGTRGIRIADELSTAISNQKSITSLTNTRAFGIFEGKIIGAVQNDKLLKIHAEKIIVTTGAYERTLVFENNDLPGVYGAGGVQTLMNTYGVKPGSKVLIVGSGNVGLILAYQLLQSGVEVLAVVEAMPTIGGYAVHAMKVRRYGVKFMLRHTIIRALGHKRVDGAIIAKLDDAWQPIKGTEEIVKCDTICIAVGLIPTYELVQQAGAKLKFSGELGGFVPLRTKHMEVADGIDVAGDISGIEEATTAMLDGQIAGLHASLKIKHGDDDVKRRIQELLEELDAVRAGPFGVKIKEGLAKVLINEVSLTDSA